MSYKKIIFTLSFTLFISLHADIITSSHFSDALGFDQYYEIVLPPSYESNPDSSYPTLYFLHGFGADYSWYVALVEVFESMMASGEIRESILIKPDGFVLPYLGSMYTNSEYNGQFEDYIIQDLVPYIDSTYNTVNSPENRAILGHSMGGYGAVKLAIKFPELFQISASHSGPIAFQNIIPDLLPPLLDETGILGYQPWNGVVSLFLYSASAAFSPDVEDWPYYVDLPVDSYGNVIEEVWGLWLLQDPLTLAQNNLENIESTRFYMDCGDADEYLFNNHSDSFSDFLNDQNIHHDYILYAGDHVTEVFNGNRFPFSLAFIENAFYLNNILGNMGDMDGNGIINMLDIMVLLQIVMGESIPNESQEIVGDLDFSGTFEIFDILLLSDRL